MKYVADDIRCHAPGDEIHGKTAYREFLGNWMPPTPSHVLERGFGQLRAIDGG